MISSLSVKLSRKTSREEPQKDPEKSVTTIQKIYEDESKSNNREDIDFLRVDPETNKIKINKFAYSKLHRSFSETATSGSSSRRQSVEGLKVRFESEKNPDDQAESPSVIEETPEIRKKPVPLPKPRHLVCRSLIERVPKNVQDLSPEVTKVAQNNPIPDRSQPDSDKQEEVAKEKIENSNNVNDNEKVIREDESVEPIIKSSHSSDSIDLITKGLSDFTMDRKSNKERKRTNSFRKIFSGGFFSQKDKKKKDEDKIPNTLENRVYNDNSQNETNSNRKVEYSQPQQLQQQQQQQQHQYQNQKSPEYLEKRDIERKFAEMHMSRFNQIRQNFTEPKQPEVPLEQPKKKSIADFIDRPVRRYIDSSSSSASTESDRPAIAPIRQSAFRNDHHRNTPPRAQETYHNFQPIKPIRPTHAQIPINSERPLPNPFQANERTTIERNLNKSNDKPQINGNKELIEDTYGTVFDNIPITPKSPTLEGSKLRMPPNREILEVQPRVKSPIPSSQISTEKLIATELLRSPRSPTPPKRVNSRLSTQELVSTKPPMSPKILQKKPSEISLQNEVLVTGPQIVTNAMVHSDNVSLRSMRSPTPTDLRKSASLKLSPQKGDIRKSVEEYYWKELKKIKEQDDYNLYLMQMYNRDRRSRSVSPSQLRGRRSLSLPRENPQTFMFNNDAIYATRVPLPIPEHDVIDRVPRRRISYDQPQPQNVFIRNQPERRTFDGGNHDNGAQRPIFRRGSLNKSEESYYENQPYNKRVSFSSNQAAWPTRNGYTQSPPQRRIDKRESVVEDDVFLPNSPRQIMTNDPNYEYYYVRNEPIYGYAPQVNRMQQIPRSPQAVYYARNPGVPQGREQLYVQLPLQRPQQNVASSRRSLADSPLYGSTRQVTVSDKVCDFYGQIHDVSQQSTGVLMGQLQQGPPVVRYNNNNVGNQPYTSASNVNNNVNQNFPRGSRLTSSANDMGRRPVNPNNAVYYRDDVNKYNGTYSGSFDNRPLPPTPTKSDLLRSKGPVRCPQVSDTESGSDASEIQRIMMQSKSKSKKRGFFGK